MADELEDVVVTATRIEREQQREGGTSFGSGAYGSPGELRGRGSSSLSGRSSPVPSPWVPGGGTVPQEAIPEVVVTAPAPRIGDVDPEEQFHIPTAGSDVVVGAPRSLPTDPYGIHPPLRRDALERLQREFVGREPVPEVKVEAKRPPQPPPSIFVGGAAFARFIRLLNPFLALISASRSLNLGEDRRVREQIERDLASRLLPVDVRVGRLAEPLPVVTVRGSRISSRPATRTPASLRGSALRGPVLARVRAPFVATPTAFTLPAPQRLARRTGVSAIVEPLGGLIYAPPLPTPGRRTRVTGPGPSTRPIAPDLPLPLVPGVPSIPGVRPVVPVTPILTPLNPGGVPLPLTAPQLQPQRCVCPKPVKTAQKRKPRVECWRGTYVETAGGLIKSRKEKVPCR